MISLTLSICDHSDKLLTRAEANARRAFGPLARNENLEGDYERTSSRMLYLSWLHFVRNTAHTEIRAHRLRTSGTSAQKYPCRSHRRCGRTGCIRSDKVSVSGQFPRLLYL